MKKKNFKKNKKKKHKNPLRPFNVHIDSNAALIMAAGNLLSAFLTNPQRDIEIPNTVNEFLEATDDER